VREFLPRRREIFETRRHEVTKAQRREFMENTFNLLYGLKIFNLKILKNLSNLTNLKNLSNLTNLKNLSNLSNPSNRFKKTSIETFYPQKVSIVLRRQ
jgi:hypothetical protein